MRRLPPAFGAAAGLVVGAEAAASGFAGAALAGVAPAGGAAGGAGGPLHAATRAMPAVDASSSIKRRRDITPRGCRPTRFGSSRSPDSSLLESRWPAAGRESISTKNSPYPGNPVAAHEGITSSACDCAPVRRGTGMLHEATPTDSLRCKDRCGSPAFKLSRGARRRCRAGRPNSALPLMHTPYACGKRAARPGRAASRLDLRAGLEIGNDHVAISGERENGVYLSQNQPVRVLQTRGESPCPARA